MPDGKFGMGPRLGFALLLLFVAGAHARGEGSTPYSEALFEATNDSSKVVLQLVIHGGLSGRSSSTTVYGDGRVELRKSLKGEIVEEHEFVLEPSAVRDLVASAVRRGVAEWDAGTIRAWMRQKHPRIPDIADSARVHVSLHLDSYERGEREAGPLSVSFTTKAPRTLAELYPEIHQFRGVADLVEWASEQWSRVAPDRKIEP